MKTDLWIEKEIQMSKRPGYDLAQKIIITNNNEITKLIFRALHRPV
jgi:hypothetical protein